MSTTTAVELRDLLRDTRHLEARAASVLAEWLAYQGPGESVSGRVTKGDGAVKNPLLWLLDRIYGYDQDDPRDIWEYVAPDGRVLYRRLDKPELPAWPRVRSVTGATWRKYRSPLSTTETEA